MHQHRHLLCVLGGSRMQSILCSEGSSQSGSRTNTSHDVEVRNDFEKPFIIIHDKGFTLNAAGPHLQHPQLDHHCGDPKRLDFLGDDCRLPHLLPCA